MRVCIYVRVLSAALLRYFEGGDVVSSLLGIGWGDEHKQGEVAVDVVGGMIGAPKTR